MKRLKIDCTTYDTDVYQHLPETRKKSTCSKYAK